MIVQTGIFQWIRPTDPESKEDFSGEVLWEGRLTAENPELYVPGRTEITHEAPGDLVLRAQGVADNGNTIEFFLSGVDVYLNGSTQMIKLDGAAPSCWAALTGRSDKFEF